MMRAGQMRTRFTIQKPRRLDNHYGEQEPKWDDVVDWWGELKPIAATERVKAQQVQQETTHRVRMRYTAHLTSDCRLLIKGTKRALNIVTLIDVDELNAEFQIACNEVTH